MILLDYGNNKVSLKTASDVDSLYYELLNFILDNDIEVNIVIQDKNDMDLLTEADE